jgi:hypothetical protein
MRLGDRTPKSAILLDVEHSEARQEPAIAAARPWDTAAHVADGDIPRPARIWADHVRQNTRPGVVAALGRRAISESVLAAGLAVDYSKNL